MIQTIDTIVNIHPRRIRTTIEADEILNKILAYETLTGKKAGVVLVQNRQLGASYEIVSEQEAADGMREHTSVERYVHFYSREYLEHIRNELTDRQ